MYCKACSILVKSEIFQYLGIYRKLKTYNIENDYGYHDNDIIETCFDAYRRYFK